MIKTLLFSGAGIGFILFVLARVMPNEDLKKYGISLGKAISRFGVGKFGKSVWEKFEDFFQNGASIFLSGVKEGLDSDDEKKDN